MQQPILPPIPRCRPSPRHGRIRLLYHLAVLILVVPHGLSAENTLQLPTANHALFETGAEDKFFVGTTGKPWTTGTFGCVRTEGRQMHEGLDIRCIKRDKRGEPKDPIMATAEGEVAYINDKSPLSNYGKYIVLRHQVDELEIYSIYAHLSVIAPEMKPGRPVKAGEVIGIMGRTTNTRESISKERAHVHFELNLLVNDRFPAWYKKTFPDQRNDHGAWNGQNLVAIDPREILLAQRNQGAKFNLAAYLRNQTALCRVLVRDTNFPWLKRYPQLLHPNSVADQEGVAGYEIALNYNGVPFGLTPRAASEIKGKSGVQLLTVNDAEERKHPCRRLVAKRGSRWELTAAGRNLMSLLVF